MIPPQDALQRLREGNARYVANAFDTANPPDQTRRASLADGAQPIAIVLGCADSRVPPELVFDQPLGDLFTIRVAGNVAAPTQIASVEFAALQFHTRLVVVLGHCRCVAILTALRQLTHPHEKVTSNQEVLMNYIRPAVEPLLTPDADSDDPDLVETAVRLNAAHSIGLLRGSTGLHRLMDSGDLMVVGAEYSMDTGVVEFFENTPSA